MDTNILLRACNSQTVGYNKVDQNSLGNLFFIAALTYAIDVVILGPPLDPMTSLTLPVPLSTRMLGAMDDTGLFPGRSRLSGDGLMPHLLGASGYEKSSRRLLRMIPVEGDM